MGRRPHRPKGGSLGKLFTIAPLLAVIAPGAPHTVTIKPGSPRRSANRGETLRRGLHHDQTLQRRQSGARQDLPPYEIRSDAGRSARSTWYYVPDICVCVYEGDQQRIGDRYQTALSRRVTRAIYVDNQTTSRSRHQRFERCVFSAADILDRRNHRGRHWWRRRWWRRRPWWQRRLRWWPSASAAIRPRHVVALHRWRRRGRWSRRLWWRSPTPADARA